jgi:hypothetical protein
MIAYVVSRRFDSICLDDVPSDLGIERYVGAINRYPDSAHDGDSDKRGPSRAPECANPYTFKEQIEYENR